MEPDISIARRPTVLVVEDEPVARLLLSELLESEGLRVLTANDGLVAVSLAIQHRPDLILMDIGLPLMDGYQAAERIRQIHVIRHTPIIACTALGRADDASTEGLFEAVLSKPFSDEHVLAAVNAALSRTGKNQARPPTNQIQR